MAGLSTVIRVSVAVFAKIGAGVSAVEVTIVSTIFVVARWLMISLR